MPELNGGEIIAKYLEREGVEYLAGIPGHGSTNILDAFNDVDIEVIQPRHEQGAVHLADGYARASGDPIAVFTSIGMESTNAVAAPVTVLVAPGPMEVNTAMGSPLARAYPSARWTAPCSCRG